MGVIANYLRYIVCRSIVSTFNSAWKFNRGIGSRHLIVENPGIELKFKIKVEMHKLYKGQSENCFIFEQPYNMPSQLY